jgi:hypothetical protein
MHLLRVEVGSNNHGVVAMAKQQHIGRVKTGQGGRVGVGWIWVHFRGPSLSSVVMNGLF